MAVTQNTYTGNGSTTLYSFTFPYLEEDEIKVSLNGTLTTAYTLANATTISFTTAPANGVAIRIYRDTNVDSLQSTFFAGSAIRAQDLNDNFLQSNYSVQEIKDRFLDRTGGTMSGNLAMGGNKITGLGTPTAANDAANKSYVDTVISAGISDGDKGDITVSGTGTIYTIDSGVITDAKVSASAAIAGTKIASASTSVQGAVQLTDSTSSTSITTAATPNSVKSAFDLANAALPKSGGTMTGNITLAGAPSSNLHPATKLYVDTADALKADLGTAQSFTKAQRGTPVALTDAATVAVDLSLGNFYTLLIGGNRTLGAPTNQTAGQSGVIVITQDGTGSRTLAYNSVYKFPSGTAPTLTTTANAVDVLVYYVESATRITCRLLSDVK